MIKIVADDKIPYLKGVFESIGCEVVYLSGSKITRKDLIDADALITRTRTICNEDLLHGTRVQIITTATIGYDHIDTQYCDSKGIKWTNAPGCNSGSVQQYIASALVTFAKINSFKFAHKTIGIVGYGNVGTKVAKIAEALGMRVLINDPPRARQEGNCGYVNFETIQKECDIITFHVPLNKNGEDKTFHLADDVFFANIKPETIVMNSSRGEVVDNKALKNALAQHKLSGALLDVWEDEPNIDPQLLNLTTIATPHIAGYSKDGKANGTSMSVQAVSRFFNLGLDDWQCPDIEPPSNPILSLNGSGFTFEELMYNAVNHTYNIMNDDVLLRKSPSDFEKQRGDYPVRREFGSYTCQCLACNEKVAKALQEIGFNVPKHQ